MNNEDRPVEIKYLNKTQLILLAILLSFVVSIATGIVTVTLLQQAPPAVTQTINRVVQQTIEKVVPDYTPGSTTVVVKEDDMVVDAVTKARSNLVAVYETADAKDYFTKMYSYGDGIFVSDSAKIDSTKTYYIKRGDAPIAMKVFSSSDNGISVLKTDASYKGAKDLPRAMFGKDSDIKSGQTNIVVSDVSIYKDTVQNVILKEEKDKDGKVTDKWSVVILGNSLSSSLSGAPVSNLYRRYC